MRDHYVVVTGHKKQPQAAPIIASVHGHAQAVVIVKDHANMLDRSLAGSAASIDAPRPQPGLASTEPAPRRAA